MSDELFPFMKLVHKIMHYIPHVLIILSIFSWIVIALTSEYYALRSLIIFIPLILTSIFLIVNKNLCLDDGKSFLNINSSILTKIILVFISLQFISALLVGFTSPLFLILTVLIYLIIFFQIISKSPVKGIILAEIFITTLILVLSQQLGVALWYGDGDLIGHYTVAAHIADIGCVSPEFYTNYIGGWWKDYGVFSLYHILIAIGIMIFGLEPNISLYIISIVAVLTSVFFVYKLTAWFFNSYRAALLAALFYSIMPSMLGTYIDPAPRAMASAAFIIVLYLVFVLFSKQKKISSVLLLFMLTYMALVHHAQHLFILATSLLLVLGVVLYYWGEIRYKYIPLVITAFVSLMTLLIGYGETLRSILRERLLNQIPEITNPPTLITPSNPPTSTLTPSTGDATTISELLLSSTEPNTLLSTVINVLPVSIMMVFCLVGIYYTVTKAQFAKKIGILVPALLVLFIPFLPGLLDMFPVITSSLQIYRYRILIAPLFAIVMGIGYFVLMNNLSLNHSKIINRIIIIFPILFIVGSIALYGFPGFSIGNGDEIINEKYLMESDKQILYFSTCSVQDINNLHSDREYMTYLVRIGSAPQPTYYDDSMFKLLTGRGQMIRGYFIVPIFKLLHHDINVYSNIEFGERSFESVSITESYNYIYDFIMRNHNILYSNNRNVLYYNNIMS